MCVCVCKRACTRTCVHIDFFHFILISLSLVHSSFPKNRHFLFKNSTFPLFRCICYCNEIPAIKSPSVIICDQICVSRIRMRKLSQFNFLFCSRYGGIRGSYQHFGGQGGQDSGFPSPRSALGYPFPPMHQNSYSGYHLGSYAPPCSSPPKDGM